jgi:hypothetical protein
MNHTRTNNLSQQENIRRLERIAQPDTPSIFRILPYSDWSRDDLDAYEQELWDTVYGTTVRVPAPAF